MPPPSSRNPDPRAPSHDRYRAFQQKYYNDPAGFARDCIAWGEGEGLTSYQEEILAQVPIARRVCAMGPHGLGKTAMAAILIHWYALTRDGRNWKIITTASVYYQLKTYLWPEVHIWGGRLRWDKIGRTPYAPSELMKMTIQLKTGKASAKSPGMQGKSRDKDATSLEGAHADHLFYLFDESKAVPDGVFDSAEGAFSTDTEAYAVAISTPGDPIGRFYDIQSRKPGFSDWWVRQVTKEECIAAGQMSAGWANSRAIQWGESSATYINRVLGQFAETAEAAGVIPRAWVKLARARWRVLNEHRETWAHRIEGYGVDIGEYPDRTVLAPRVGNIIDTLEVLPATVDLMQVAEQLRARCQPKNRWARIDMVGFGAGVYDRARQLGVRCEKFDARRVSTGRDKTGEIEFNNFRTYAYWALRDMLNPAYATPIALPDDQELEDELCAHVYRQREGGKYHIGDKDTVMRKLGRSPDKADAVVIAMIPMPVSAIPTPGRRPSIGI